MLLDGKINDEPESDSPDTPSRTWAIWVGVCLLPLYILFSSLGARGKGNAAMCFAVPIIILVRLNPNLRNRIWFWLTVGVFSLLHLALVLFVPWPNKDYTFAVIFPVGIVDYFLISYLTRSIAKWKGESDPNLTVSV